MTNLRTLVARIRDDLGVGGLHANATELAEMIDPVVTAIPVSDTAGIGPGIIEIDFERIRIKSVEGNYLNAFTFGRGYAGSVADSHQQGSMVMVNPMVPASTVVQSINSVLSSLFPLIYAIDAVTDQTPVNHMIQLPESSYGVNSVWEGARRLTDYKYEQATRVLTIQENTEDPLTVLYAKKPGLFDQENLGTEVEFEDATFLSNRLEHLVRLGVAAELAPRFDFARLLHTGVEHRVDPQSKPAGQAASLARYLQAQYQDRLEIEAATLQKEYPVRVHYERWGRI